MFWKRLDREKKKIEKAKKKEAYDRVLALHQNAQFLCYIDEVYTEDKMDVLLDCVDVTAGLKETGAIVINTTHENDYLKERLKGWFMKDLPLISVIIPVFNVENYLDGGKIMDRYDYDILYCEVVTWQLKNRTLKT